MLKITLQIPIVFHLRETHTILNLEPVKSINTIRSVKTIRDTNMVRNMSSVEVVRFLGRPKFLS